MAASLLIKPIVDAFVSAWAFNGVKITVTSAVRTKAEQEYLYQTNTQYPTALPGRSQHEYGCAVDMVADPREYQHSLGEVWKIIGFYWSSSDEIHFPVFSPTQWAQILSYLQPVEAPPTYKPVKEKREKPRLSQAQQDQLRIASSESNTRGGGGGVYFVQELPEVNPFTADYTNTAELIPSIWPKSGEIYYERSAQPAPIWPEIPRTETYYPEESSGPAPVSEPAPDPEPSAPSVTSGSLLQTLVRAPMILGKRVFGGLLK